MRLGRDGDDGVERAADEIGELELDDRPLAHPGRADRRADEALLGDRRVDDALLAELLEQPLRDAERPAEVADVLAEQEDPLVLAQRVGERGADRLEVRDLGAHSPPRAELIPTPSGASRDILGTVSSRYANHPRAFATYDRVGRRRGVAPDDRAGHAAIPPSTRSTAPVM